MPQFFLVARSASGILRLRRHRHVVASRRHVVITLAFLTSADFCLRQQQQQRACADADALFGSTLHSNAHLVLYWIAKRRDTANFEVNVPLRFHRARACDVRSSKRHHVQIIREVFVVGLGQLRAKISRRVDLSRYWREPTGAIFALAVVHPFSFEGSRRCVRNGIGAAAGTDTESHFSPH